MDVFIEHLVKKKSTAKDTAIRALVILGLIVVIFLCIFVISGIQLLSTFTLFIMAGAFWGAWWIFTSLNIEFEYSLTNGEVDIDRIVSQRKRTRLITVNARNVETMGKYTAAAFATRKFDSRIIACADENDAENTWYVTLRHPKLGNSLVVFNPDERILNGMKQFLPKQVAYDVFVRNRLGGN